MLTAISAMVLGAVSCAGDDAVSAADPAETTVVSAALSTTSSSGADASTVTTGTTAVELTGTLTVMAPGPFKGLLDAAKTEFESEHPGVAIEFNLGHVPTLLNQLKEGVVADVLITPDAGTMGQAATAGVVTGGPAVFARVPMALVVPAGNAAGVRGIDALADGALRVAVCAAELPCGKLANQLAANAGISIDADTMEPGGSPGVVTKASTGEIDVGLVFATDIAAGGANVQRVTIPDAVNVASDASAAAVAASDDAELAAAFIEWLRSTDGVDLVVAKGFLAP